MLRQLTAAQFAEWACYFRLEPSDDIRSDSLAAQQLAMLGNINISKDKKEPFSPLDFMPWVISDKKAELDIKPAPIDHNAQSVRLKALFSKKGKSK